MRAAAIAIASLLAVPATAQVVTDMTPELIKQAIADKKGKPCYPISMGSTMAMTKRDVGCFSTPYSRVVAAARAAQKAYKPFTEADVTVDMFAPEVRVIASAVNRIHGVGAGIISPKTVVVMPIGVTDIAAAIQPSKTEEVDQAFTNAYGAEWRGKTIVASFPLSVLSEKNELRIVYDGPCGAGGPGSRNAEGGFTTDCGSKFKLDKVR